MRERCEKNFERTSNEFIQLGKKKSARRRTVDVEKVRTQQIQSLPPRVGKMILNASLVISEIYRSFEDVFAERFQNKRSNKNRTENHSSTDNQARDSFHGNRVYLPTRRLLMNRNVHFLGKTFRCKFAYVEETLHCCTILSDAFLIPIDPDS